MHLEETIKATLKYLGELSPEKGAGALISIVVSAVSAGAMKGWYEARKTNAKMQRESAKMDDEQTGQHAPVGREDTAVIALRRITAEAQCEADSAREEKRLALIALDASELESRRLRERVRELEREHSELRSEVAAKGAALDRLRAEYAAVSSRLATTLSREVEPLRKLVRELARQLNGLIGDDGHPIRIPDNIDEIVTSQPSDLRTSQRPTPVSGLHGVVPEVRVPALPPIKIGPDDVTPPKPRRLPRG